jgi:hypothetical protein
MDPHQYVRQQAIDATGAALGAKSTYIGATTSIGSWFLSSEFGMLAGVILGLAGLCVSIFFQLRRDRREEREHRHRLARRAQMTEDSV